MLALACHEPHGIQQLLRQDAGGLGSAGWLFSQTSHQQRLAIRKARQLGSSGWWLGHRMMVSLSRDTLARVGATGHGRHPNSQGGFQGSLWLQLLFLPQPFKSHLDKVPFTSPQRCSCLTPRSCIHIPSYGAFVRR